MGAKKPAPAKPKFFRTAAAFGAWLDAHHNDESELLVGFYKKGTGRPSITYPEALDEALIVGWIDGVRRSVDDDSYSIRFTPRKPRSIWSLVNIRRVNELTKAGRMKRAGLAAFDKRDEKRSAVYSYEREAAALDIDAIAALKADRKAWSFYDAQAPWYKRTAAHWVTSAKKPETRERRLATLIACCKKGERIPPLA
jgi:uncharacterized protein YdeI (YjbR/CyaY-like superfamily)